MSRENFPQPEQNLPTEPTLEAQRALLDEVNKENSQQLLESGVLEKAQTAYLAEVQEVGHAMLAYTAPEAIDDTIERHAQRGSAEIERTLDPSEYTVNHQVAGDMTEFYSVTYGKTRNILVGRTEIDPDGTARLVPEEGFTEDDIAVVKKMADDLAERKAKGELPDLTSDLQYVYNPDKETKAEAVEVVAVSESNELTELRKQQSERDKQDEITISNFRAHGATEQQIQGFREDVARMKEAELMRGRLFPHQAGFARFEALSKPSQELDMGVGSGFEQGDWVTVQRSSGEVQHQWTFMGIDPTTGLAEVAAFDEETGDRLSKSYSLDELRKLNKRNKK